MGQNEHHLDERTRAKLLETARAMVLRGDSKFSVTSLCAQAGFERAVSRAHFCGKTALMAALMAQSAPEVQPVTQPAPQTAPEPLSESVSEPVAQAPAAVSTVSQPVS